MLKDSINDQPTVAKFHFITGSNALQQKFIKTSPLMGMTKTLTLHVLGFLGFPYPARLAATNKQLNKHLQGSAVDLFDSTLAAHEMVKYFPSDYWQITGMSLHFSGDRAEPNHYRLPPLAFVRRLRIVGLVKTLNFLSQCPHLVMLELPSSYWVSDLTPAVSCRSLLHLSLSNCLSLASLAPLAQCLTLESVRLMDAAGVTDLAPLVTARALNSVTLSNLPETINLSVLQFCNLRSLSLSLPWIESLKCLGTCTVRSFMIQSAVLKDVSALALWPHLEKVTFNFCPELVEISALTRCPTLEYVRLQNSLPLKQACAQLRSSTTVPSLDPASESIKLERRIVVLGKRQGSRNG